MSRHDSTVLPDCDLVAAVYRQALAAAMVGDAAAVAWLAMVAPDALHRVRGNKPKRVLHKLNRMTDIERQVEQWQK